MGAQALKIACSTDSTLKDVLNSIALRTSLYFRTDFRPPFGVTVPAFAEVARFHLLVKGRCLVRVGDGADVVMNAGDLVLVPNGSQHLLISDQDAEPVLLDDAFAAAGYTGTGPFILGDGDPDGACQLICGHFEYAQGADHPLLRSLPDVIHIPHGTRSVRPLFDALLVLLERRLFEFDSQAMASITRLSEALFVEILQAGIEQSPEMGALMSVIGDPRISRAIVQVHQNVGAHWTVDILAQEAAMSRTRFVERFQKLVGMAPMAYVAEWRMQRGLVLIGQGRLPIKTIAHECGYQSPAAFSRAFAKRFGRAPEKSRPKV